MLYVPTHDWHHLLDEPQQGLAGEDGMNIDGFELLPQGYSPHGGRHLCKPHHFAGTFAATASLFAPQFGTQAAWQNMARAARARWFWEAAELAGFLQDACRQAETP